MRNLNTYGTLAPGMKSHVKFPCPFLSQCLVWSFRGFLFLMRLKWGCLFQICKVSHCILPQKIVWGVSGQLLTFKCFFVKDLDFKKMAVKRTNFTRWVLLSCPQFLSIWFFFFTGSSRVDIQNFCILFTNLQKILFMCRSE